ncbi:MAG TPA: hypothetical protein VJU60_00500 [Thermoleophilaceae bacterium]|nr:hypothetical protein [Thermoleophilaceae bacterium]
MALRLVDFPPGRRARRRRAERRTQVLAGVALLTTLAAGAAEYGRVWRRGETPLPQETDDVLLAAGEAAADTVAVARAGYQEVSIHERALLNLFSSFLLAFVGSRALAYALRGRRTVGPFRNLVVGDRHIHHFVPGISLAFASGSAALLVRDERVRSRLALAFGAGMGMTLDESALLLELEDVYWTERGLLSVQIGLIFTALMGALAVTLRLLRRGEEVVLPR